MSPRDFALTSMRLAETRVRRCSGKICAWKVCSSLALPTLYGTVRCSPLTSKVDPCWTIAPSCTAYWPSSDQTA